MNDSPPRFAAWLLTQLLREHDREVVLGDLAEEYSIRRRLAHQRAAARWYRGQVYGSVPPVLWASFRRGSWAATLAVAAAAYIVIGVVEFCAVAALSTFLTAPSALSSVLNTLVGLGTMVLGAYSAAAVRPSAARVLAVIVALVVTGMIVALPDTVPLWYQLAFLFGGPLACLAGGSLCLNRRKRRNPGRGRTDSAHGSVR
jgi:hypothetical protein